jgi:hypothetical protein
MGLGISALLLAAGALLGWVVKGIAAGVDLHAIGLILVIAGLTGAATSLIFWSSWWGPGHFVRRRVPARHYYR